jgi:hypothetical protein
MSERETVEIRHPEQLRRPIAVDAAKYRAVRDALLAVIPEDAEGVPIRTLTEAAQGHLDPRLIDPEELPRWVDDVRLDLEAKRVLEPLVRDGPPAVRRRPPG